MDRTHSGQVNSLDLSAFFISALHGRSINLPSFSKEFKILATIQQARLSNKIQTKYELE